MDFLVSLHSGLRWIVLILLIAAIAFAFTQWKAKKHYGARAKMLNLFAMIAVHTQALIGLILYFISSNERGFASLQHIDIPIHRFFAVEHLLGMLTAIVLITIGRKKAETSSKDRSSHRKIWIWYGIAFIIILISIPWPFIAKFAGKTGYF